ncbi:MAG: methylmalonyl Co-A mutase-associated GTPase MeaB [Microthrixaceae bacterium]
MGTLDAEVYVEGVLGGDRTVLARAITLVESSTAHDRRLAAEVLDRLLPAAGGAHRVGITGVPGVGKSTFIDQLGVNLTGEGHRVAVLAVDPSSSRTGGSILGDKTRMGRLAVDERAFVRPSPAGGTLGGVAGATRETIVLCEAAGFDVVLVETVGVGQSETMVAEMVDIFCVLMLPGAGDDLQGIKKGVLELAELIAVNKADGDNVGRAERAAADYKLALHMTTPASPNWNPPVLTCSALHNTGMEDFWAQVCAHREVLGISGELESRRADQQVQWMWHLLDERLRHDLRSAVGGDDALAELIGEVRSSSRTPASAAALLWERYRAGRS